MNINWNDPTLTFETCLKAHVFDHIEAIISISEAAGKEYAIEDQLTGMQEAWSEIDLELIPYKESGTRTLCVKLFSVTVGRASPLAFLHFLKSISCIMLTLLTVNFRRFIS